MLLVADTRTPPESEKGGVSEAPMSALPMSSDRKGDRPFTSPILKMSAARLRTSSGYCV
jgi:hypothetical protein